MTSKLAMTCCALGILAGVGATWLVLRPGEAPAAARPPAAQRDRSADRPLPVVIEGTGARAEAIRRLVREEVRAALREHATSPAPAEDQTARAEPPAPDPTPAFDQAKDRIAQRVAQGTWTTADRDWMRGALGAVNSAERTELIRQVLIAANTGKLRVAIGVPPF